MPDLDENFHEQFSWLTKNIRYPLKKEMEGILQIKHFHPYHVLIIVKSLVLFLSQLKNQVYMSARGPSAFWECLQWVLVGVQLNLFLFCRHYSEIITTFSHEVEILIFHVRQRSQRSTKISNGHVYLIVLLHEKISHDLTIMST